MFRATLLSTLGLVACQDEQSSLLQTASRDNALAKRAQNVVYAEDEDALDDAMEGKKCTAWLADEAVAKAHDELETFRTEMKELGYEQRVKDHVKIGAYCPAMLVDTALTFLGTPCEDREHALAECTKGLTETCKYEKRAIEKMIENVKKAIKKEWEAAKKLLNKFPRELRPEFPHINFDEIFKTIKDTIKEKLDCNHFSKLKVPELTSDLFTDLKNEFKSAIDTLKGLQTDQINLFGPLLQQAENALNAAQQPDVANFGENLNNQQQQQLQNAISQMNVEDIIGNIGDPNSGVVDIGNVGVGNLLGR